MKYPHFAPTGIAVATSGALLRNLVIGLTAFLTLVDLFATQAILPTLVDAYGVSPAAMGFAVNSSTLGMAVAGLAVSFFSGRIDRRAGILLSLLLLAVPTALLAAAPNLAVFTGLRIIQGVFMATAFTLTLAYLGERCSAVDAAGAFAAYITGNVASNFLGRLVSAAAADHFGLEANFLLFAALNLAGAALVFSTIGKAAVMAAVSPAARLSPLAQWSLHLRNPPLCRAFAIGFLILFTFIGTFTYVNFVLARPPLALSPMQLGFIYFVFLPSIFTTPQAGRVVAHVGIRTAVLLSLVLAVAGLPLLLAPTLLPVLAGLVMVGIGTFFAQAITTGFVNRAATSDRGSASGIYLASYFAGGLVGSAVLGQVFDRLGWPACVAAIGLALLVAALLAGRLKLPQCEIAVARPAMPVDSAQRPVAMGS
jgi:predicted MFS family arabinose efflux permease